MGEFESFAQTQTAKKTRQYPLLSRLPVLVPHGTDFFKVQLENRDGDPGHTTTKATHYVVVRTGEGRVRLTSFPKTKEN